MAVALKSKHFKALKELNDFCAAAPNAVTTIVQIVQDNSGSWVLFYT
jgi:hypothetical protein